VWKINLLNNLLEDLEGFVWVHGEDRWRWKLEEDGVFTIKSLYNKLEGVCRREGVRSDKERRVFRQIWKYGASSVESGGLLTGTPTRS
jgi:hypothetical protein